MVKSKSSVLLIACIALFFAGCVAEKKITGLKEFNGWMKEPKNGLTMSRSVNGMIITVSYLTPEYNALKEMEAEGYKGKVTYDSLLAYYKTTASFIMTLAPDESKNNNGDIMYKGLKNFKEYVERAMSLNFDLENQVTLEADANIYAPSLSSLDNTYSLSTDRKVNFVFTPVNKKEELENATHYNFVYRDEQFDLGTLHFYFDKKNIEKNLPEISIP